MFQPRSLQVVCDRSEVYASGCAVARAFPSYTRKTSEQSRNAGGGKQEVRNGMDSVVNVEFICPDGDAVTEEDLQVLDDSAFGIRLAAEIVDTPCNEMHTDAFLDVSVITDESDLDNEGITSTLDTDRSFVSSGLS